MKVRPETLISELLSLVREICHYPEDLKFETKPDGAVLELWMTPNKADYPLLNGANARTINSIRQVALLAGVRAGKAIMVHIADDGPGEREPDRVPPHQWNGDVPMEKITNWINWVFGRHVALKKSRLPDEIEIRADIKDSDNGTECTGLTALSALNDLFYAWSRRRGLTVRIKPMRNEKSANRRNHCPTD